MTIITDTSYLVALYNSRDVNHQTAADFAFRMPAELMLVPEVVIPELAYVITRDLRYGGLQSLLTNLEASEIEFAHLQMNDLARIRDIAETYADAEFDIVDRCIMAIAERLDINRIATFDHRDFGIFRPRHCEFLELLP